MLTIFTFNGAWNNFLWPLIINTCSSMNVLTITMATLSSNQTTNYGMVMAGATLTFVFPFLLYAFPAKAVCRGRCNGRRQGLKSKELLYRAFPECFASVLKERGEATGMRGQLFQK